MRVTCEEFLRVHRDVLTGYWQTVSRKLVDWRNAYEWPRGVRLAQALARRDALEASIRADLESRGCVSKGVFDAVMEWGFGRPSRNAARDIERASAEAFGHLRQDGLEEAARAMTRLSGVGISRASKVLALSNQSELGIYDSRAAHGLADLLADGRRLIPIPPGRAVGGDTGVPPDEFCRAFETYTWVLRFLRDCAGRDPALRQQFGRVADLEIAFFSRSRAVTGEAQAPSLSGGAPRGVELDAGDRHFTLGVGGKATSFWANIDENGVTVLTGPQGKSQLHLGHTAIEACLRHFAGRDWFPLGNSVDDAKPGGLGEYFQNTLGVSPKFASHLAAVLVSQGRLECRYGHRHRVELRVVQGAMPGCRSVAPYGQR